MKTLTLDERSQLSLEIHRLDYLIDFLKKEVKKAEERKKNCEIAQKEYPL